MNLETAKITRPWIPVGHPDFKWTSGADVQATWRKHGWTPPSENMTPPPPPERAYKFEPVWLYK
jgi:hypothetical protein